MFQGIQTHAVNDSLDVCANTCHPLLIRSNIIVIIALSLECVEHWVGVVDIWNDKQNFEVCCINAFSGRCSGRSNGDGREPM